MLLLDSDPHARAQTRHYNTVMNAYTRTRPPNLSKVRFWFDKMIRDGRRPDRFTRMNLGRVGLESLCDGVVSSPEVRRSNPRYHGSKSRARGRGGGGRSSRGRSSSSSSRSESCGGGRSICYTFQNTGHCRFGDRCRYSHSRSSKSLHGRAPETRPSADFFAPRRPFAR